MLQYAEKKSGLNSFVILFFIFSIVVDLFVWKQVVYGKISGEARIYFLDVGQGDAELIIFPGNVKILTDAGPDSKILGQLEKIPQLADKYIDLAVISHPQLDHFNGFRYLTDRYRFGAFIYNGRSDSANVQEWPDLIGKIKKNNIPLVKFGAGDRIKYRTGKIDFLSPNAGLSQSAELNDTGLVELVESGGIKALFTADIDSITENYLSSNFDIRADILKVAHHGSKYSSSAAFLKTVSPKVAVIGVGARNNYGHPTPETLKKLSALAAVFRTDQNGMITASVNGNKLVIFTEKQPPPQ